MGYRVSPLLFNRIPFISSTVTYDGMLATGIEGAATLDLIENPPQEIAEFYGNWGPRNSSGWQQISTIICTTGDSRVEQETPSMDFYTDMMFLSQEQKSLELMSRHTDKLCNYHLMIWSLTTSPRRKEEHQNIRSTIG